MNSNWSRLVIELDLDSRYFLAEKYGWMIPPDKHWVIDSDEIVLAYQRSVFNPATKDFFTAIEKIIGWEVTCAIEKFGASETIMGLELRLPERFPTLYKKTRLIIGHSSMSSTRDIVKIKKWFPIQEEHLLKGTITLKEKKRIGEQDFEIIDVNPQWDRKRVTGNAKCAILDSEPAQPHLDLLPKTTLVDISKLP